MKKRATIEIDIEYDSESLEPLTSDFKTGIDASEVDIKALKFNGDYQGLSLAFLTGVFLVMDKTRSKEDGMKQQIKVMRAFGNSLLSAWTNLSIVKEKQTYLAVMGAIRGIIEAISTGAIKSVGLPEDFIDKVNKDAIYELKRKKTKWN